MLLGFLAIAAFFLWEEHRAHLLGALPYVLLLLCPLLHLFHGGHGGHGGGDGQHKDHAKRAFTGFQGRHKMEEAPAYGLWSLVIINSLVFIIFAFSFRETQTKRDWRWADKPYFSE